ncbi:hypothetical protein ABK040_005560 [Willaertia magna]
MLKNLIRFSVTKSSSSFIKKNKISTKQLSFFTTSLIQKSGHGGNSEYISKTTEEENYKLEKAAEQHANIIKDINEAYVENEHFILDLEALPPIEVEGETAVCNGFLAGGLGHPTEYIRVNYHSPERCKYCGAKFIRKD